MILTRRGFLGAALAIGLAGCVPMPDPRLDASTAGFNRRDILQQAGDAETAVATAYAAAGAALCTGNTPSSGADWCAAASPMHAAHAATLSLPDPWNGFRAPATVPPPNPAPSPADALVTLATAIATATDNATSGLAQASSANEGLLWASLLVCLQVGAAWCADPTVARPASTAGDIVPSYIEIASVADAAGSALDRCNALRFMLTAAMGQTPRSSQLHTDLNTRLQQAGALVSSLQDIIRSAGATPAAPQLSYQLLNALDNDADIRLAWGDLEAKLADSYTYLAGAQTGADGVASAQLAGDQFARAGTMGQTITWWPGWPN